MGGVVSSVLGKGDAAPASSSSLQTFIGEAISMVPFGEKYAAWWINLFHSNPLHLVIETSLILFILFILLCKWPRKKRKREEKLPPGIVEELIQEFEPEPLCPEPTEQAKILLDPANRVVLESNPFTHCKVRGYDQPLLNLASFDFLALGERSEVYDAAKKALDKYGCGSCGPRGFYGTIDAHLDFEDAIAKFYGAEEAIMYSDTTSTVASAIPAFSNRADILIVDAGVNDAVMTGCKLSRSRLLFFKHNDVADLRRVLEQVKEEDERAKKKPQRRFIVIEGLYRNYGDIAPLAKIVDLKEAYKWRLIVDETYSFGVLGPSGKGITEHFGLSFDKVELMVASMATTLSSVGGFCVGRTEIVDHQRLSGAGYCFSASSPPFLSCSAVAALEILEKEKGLLKQLVQKVRVVHAALDGAERLSTQSDPNSPVIHVRVSSTPSDRVQHERMLRDICRAARDEGVLAVASVYAEPSPQKKGTTSGVFPTLPPPTLRIAVRSTHPDDELTRAIGVLDKIAAAQAYDEYSINRKENNGSGLRSRKGRR